MCALAVFLLCSLANAANAIKIDDTKLKEELKGQQGALGLAYSEVDVIERELGVDLSALDAKSAFIVVGEGLTAPEKASLALSKTNSPKLFANSRSASDTSIAEVEKSNKLVILIGGPSQNSITQKFYDQELFNKKRHEFLNQIVVATGKSKAGAKLLVVSDKRGYSNIARKAASYSPLSLCIPLSWVPVVASMIGAFLTSVVHTLWSLGQTYFESVLSDRKKSKMKITHTQFQVAGVKAREVLAVIASSFILGAAIAWTYAGPSWEFLGLLFLNVFICLVGGFSHEVIHWTMGRMLKIETEYHFWLSGALTTLFSAFLGNAFGLQGFLLDEVKEGTPKWKLGLMKLASPVFSCFVMIVFAAVNFFLPNTVFQMVYSVAGVLAMAEILPFKPMDGHDVRKWNILIWLIAFGFISASFLLVNFVV
jgi:hypothetical protein